MGGKTTRCLIPAARGDQLLLSFTLSNVVFISRESEACGAGALAASAPSLVVHTHGCLAVMQAKLETELMTLLTGAQVQLRNLSRNEILFQVLSILVLLVSLICLVVGLCTGHYTDI